MNSRSLSQPLVTRSGLKRINPLTSNAKTVTFPLSAAGNQCLLPWPDVGFSEIFTRQEWQEVPAFLLYKKNTYLLSVTAALPLALWCPLWWPTTERRLWPRLFWCAGRQAVSCPAATFTLASAPSCQLNAFPSRRRRFFPLERVTRFLRCDCSVTWCIKEEQGTFLRRRQRVFMTSTRCSSGIVSQSSLGQWITWLSFVNSTLCSTNTISESSDGRSQIALICGQKNCGIIIIIIVFSGPKI